MTVGSQVKSCFSSVKSVEASLQLLENKTQDPLAKETFNNVQKIITEVKDDLQKQVIQLSKEEPQYK
ncbi:hypothetical protein CIL05_14360 [Virgibacillus profundi]|uniref:DUF1657 domain-containing protein n=1 Tax=Virgibacillus profundi TaxID=2024555 RepID=A0A2A2IB02_9BACI|nr:DUF1657 domain-containing protein [Virgibacillus profundi]PAV28807.1 hypothetical protein CIL05_14360 [Virgibacillus profundi]PXY52975.1 DUF1657 domain-containing protein [Virgibacillus profundi]